jgi:mannose-1-phosphate guanylyltransferase / mannose-6-phosphate isomerase
LSRENFPKQLIPVMGGELSLFQMTLVRLSSISGVAPPIIVCNESHRFMVAAQMHAVNVASSVVILEPEGRNTCPAAAVAALEVSKDGSDSAMLIMPADHLIRELAPFAPAIETGGELASEGRIVTFGIVPDRPETGYGYIKKGQHLPVACSGSGPACEAFLAGGFTEKPDYSRACSYVSSGAYFWNSGIFMFRPSVFLKELEQFCPAILESCRSAHTNARRDLDFVRLDDQSFLGCPGNSIDYAVMEKTSLAAVVPLDVGWSDVGSWHSLYEVQEKDEHGNVLKGDVFVDDVRNCYIHSDGRLIAAVGIEDQIIVETKDAVLVTAGDRSQDVKLVVQRLKAASRDEVLTHPKTYRPWGSYENIDTGDRFQVRRLTVNPGASFSSEMHYHRVEHWIVVKGMARITKGDEVFQLNEDQSTHIPCGTKHRLDNPGKIPLELIEIQSGSYLGEDDILRFEDRYGRA